MVGSGPFFQTFTHIIPNSGAYGQFDAVSVRCMYALQSDALIRERCALPKHEASGRISLSISRPHWGHLFLAGLGRDLGGANDI